MEQLRILIDTSILIDHLRKSNKTNSSFYQLTQKYNCIISVITQYEFEIGITPHNRHFSETLLSKLEVLPFDCNYAII